jgi:hypothetical protein
MAPAGAAPPSPRLLQVAHGKLCRLGAFQVVFRGEGASLMRIGNSAKLTFFAPCGFYVS